MSLQETLKKLSQNLPAEHQEAFVRFIESNEESKAFFDYLDQDPRCQQIVEEGLRLKAAQIDERTRATLREYFSKARTGERHAPAGVAGAADPHDHSLFGKMGRVVQGMLAGSTRSRH